MFVIKGNIKKKLIYQPVNLISKDSLRFPNKPISILKSRLKLERVAYVLKENKLYPSLGNMISYPNKVAVEYWRKLIPYNPNNLGNWSNYDKKFPVLSAKIEYELISKMRDLYKCDQKNIDGYVTSGSTEGNIVSCWMGRKFMEEKGINASKIMLLKTNLTHYSINKAADLVGIKSTTIPVDEDLWGIDVPSLKSKLIQLIKSGKNAFLIPLTIGYTSTGTSDPIDMVIKCVKQLKKDYGVYFFIWIDAAQSGLVKPFTDLRFTPFLNREIRTFIIDFHKFGFAPISSGLMLYRSTLRKLIEKPIDYLEQKDNTLLGSRNGISAIACSAIIDSLGKVGFKSVIQNNLKLKNSFLNMCVEKYKNEITIINDKESLSAGLILNDIKQIDKMKQLETEFGIKFRQHTILTNGGLQKYYLARVSFLDIFPKRFTNKIRKSKQF